MANEVQKMLELATKARENSYSPYSHFAVGVCILSKEGNYHIGCNVENASYPEGICGEANAIGSMIVAGDKKIEAILIKGPDHKAISPCGACRQRIIEFSTKDTLVYMFDDNDNLETRTIGELLPDSFNLNE